MAWKPLDPTGWVPPAQRVRIGDVVRRQDSPPNQLFVVVDIKPPLVLLWRLSDDDEVASRDFPFGVGEHTLEVAQ